MPGQMGQPTGTIDMQPIQYPIHPNAGLVSMLQSARRYPISDVFDRWDQPFCRLFDPAQQRAFRDLSTADLPERFAGPSHRKQLPLMQIHCHGFDLMFSHLQADGRQVQHVAALGDHSCSFEEGLLAMAARWRPMRNDLIGNRHLRKRVSAMTWLASGWVRALGAPTAGLSPQSITRWRFTRRSAVFRQARFQLLHVLFELFYLFSQRQQFGYQGFEHVIFFSDGLQLFPKGLQFFFWLHRFPLAGFSHFGKSSAELSSYVLP